MERNSLQFYSIYKSFVTFRIYISENEMQVLKQTVHLVQHRYRLASPRIWVHAMRYNRDGSAVVRTGSVEIR